MNQPLVSILIPAYNAERCLGETLQSALGQTWPHKEIIVVDDGSKDGTLSVARRYESQGVKVIAQPNHGAATARNTAFAACQGTLVQWLDADDLLLPDKIARQIAVQERIADPRALLSSEWGGFFHRPDRVEFVPTPLWADLSPVEWLVLKLNQNLFMQTGVWLVSRELTEAAGPWNTKLSFDDDGEYFARVIGASNRVWFVPEARTLYRLSGAGSLSYIGRSNRKMESLALSMELHIRHLRLLEDSERVRSACLKYLRDNLGYFHPERPDLVGKMNQLAAELGGKLELPQLPWKYAWIQKVFGWNAAKRAQAWLPRVRWSFVRSWDELLHRRQRD